MYGHPFLVKKHAKALKPVATPEQVAQARLMRRAKEAKRDFLQRQKPLF